MNKQIEALKMAIEALLTGNQYADAINSCKEALEQPAQEPVAWINYVWKPYEEESDDAAFYPDFDLDTYDNGGDPLYTHPAPTWQGLSDDEIQSILDKIDNEYATSAYIIMYARAIEQALRNKNEHLD